MIDRETAYSKMTEGEKQTFDLMVDYGFIDEAREAMKKKQFDTFPSKRQRGSDLEKKMRGRITHA